MNVSVSAKPGRSSKTSRKSESKTKSKRKKKSATDVIQVVKSDDDTDLEYDG